jgi:polyvinyl alcohol dehydrogenase (cytochrome)
MEQGFAQARRPTEGSFWESLQERRSMYAASEDRTGQRTRASYSAADTGSSRGLGLPLGEVFMKRRFVSLALLACSLWVLADSNLHAQALAQPAQAQAAPPTTAPASLGTEAGFAIFQQNCTKCHGNPDSAVPAPSPTALRQLSPEAIYDALANGLMRIQGQSLTDEQKRRVAESLSARMMGSAAVGDAKQMPNRCPSNPPLADPSAAPAWNGWGVDLVNSRFQSAQAAGLSAEQIPNLKLKWVFGFPGGVNAFGQPSIVSNRVFVGSDIGYVYSLDAATGCVYWSFQTKAGVRNAMTVGPVKTKGPGKYAVYFGDLKSNVYALDAQTGELLWTDHVEENYTSRITAAPALYAGRLYVPVSSFEEFAAKSLDYPCCTSRGSVVALDANTGRQIWKTYTIPEEPKPRRKNSMGTQLWAPAGGSVWNSPTIDVKRHAIYFGTGDSETEPASKTADAVMALDMITGKMLWVYQAQADDVFLGGCRDEGVTENCPKVEGPDADIGNSPLLRTLKNGKRIVIAGTKDGDVFGLDPDNRGEQLWRVKVADQPRSGIVWGGAADDENIYFGLSGGGAVAVQAATGKRLWSAPIAPAGTRVWQAAAVTAIPGVLFVSGGDGKLHALSTADGHTLWEYDSAREFATVNEVKAKGGSIRASGMTVAGGMLFTGSGYAIFPFDVPGNVLLAFSVQ